MKTGAPTRRERIVWAILSGAIFLGGAALAVAALIPHNEVRLTGEAVLLSPPVVAPGATVSFERPSFCNDGVDTRTTRWADLYVEGRRVASFDLGDLIFYAPPEPVCVAPSRSDVILPNYLNPGVYRLRFETRWDPSPFANPMVESSSPPFTVTP